MKPLLCALVFVLLVGFVYADELTCQYQVDETYTETVANIHDGDEIIGPTLIFDSFTKAGGGYDSFKIHNPLPIDITIKVEYLQVLTGAGPTFQKYGNTAEITIPKNDFVTLQTQYAFRDDFLGYQTYIENESIRYAFVVPSGLTVQNDLIERKVPVCRQCLGKQCLNDKQPCSTNLECGSGICSIGGYCDKTRVVDCPSGTLNCLDKSCLVPHTKKISEGYMCEWECASGYGVQGVCKKTQIQELKESLSWLAGMLLLVAIGLIILQVVKRKEIIKSGWRKRAEIIRDAEKNYQQKHEQIEELQERLNDLNYQIRKARSQSEVLDSTKREQEKVIEKIEKLREQEELEKDKLTKERLIPYHNKYGHTVHINENGYEVFENSGNLVHLWVWRQFKGQIPPGYEVHHKDRKKLNNDISNLELMTIEEHRRIHGKL